MGDTDHLAKFREGARSWNAWRKQHPESHPICATWLPVWVKNSSVRRMAALSI